MRVLKPKTHPLVNTKLQFTASQRLITVSQRLYHFFTQNIFIYLKTSHNGICNIEETINSFQKSNLMCRLIDYQLNASALRQVTLEWQPFNIKKETWACSGWKGRPSTHANKSTTHAIKREHLMCLLSFSCKILVVLSTCLLYTSPSPRD